MRRGLREHVIAHPPKGARPRDEAPRPARQSYFSQTRRRFVLNRALKSFALASSNTGLSLPPGSHIPAAASSDARRRDEDEQRRRAAKLEEERARANEEEAARAKVETVAAEEAPKKSALLSSSADEEVRRGPCPVTGYPTRPLQPPPFSCPNPIFIQCCRVTALPPHSHHCL